MIIHAYPQGPGGKTADLGRDRHTTDAGLRQHRPGRVFRDGVSPFHMRTRRMSSRSAFTCRVAPSAKAVSPL